MGACGCLIAQLCPTLCNPLDCSPSGSSVHAIFQARILEWIAISSSRGSSRPRDLAHTSCGSCTGGGFFTCWAIREAQEITYSIYLSLTYFTKHGGGGGCGLVSKANLTLYDFMDCSSPGPSVHGISQARI